MANSLITQMRLKELFNYCADTGIFTRKIAVGRHGRHKKGTLAGTKSRSGYRVISINSRRYMAHKLAWLYVYGELPKNDIDHINRIKHDNRISNLRLASRSQNMQNVAKHKHNSSGQKGVSWMPSRNKWRAYINYNYKQLHIGTFDTFEDAVAAYKSMAIKVHDFIPQ